MQSTCKIGRNWLPHILQFKPTNPGSNSCPLLCDSKLIQLAYNVKPKFSSIIYAKIAVVELPFYTMTNRLEWLRRCVFALTPRKEEVLVLGIHIVEPYMFHTSFLHQVISLTTGWSITVQKQKFQLPFYSKIDQPEWLSGMCIHSYPPK